jgi:uncharacterized protein
MPIPRTLATLPPVAGIGLRAPHVREVQERLPVIGWLEVHAENYMNRGKAARTLEKIRSHYPLSMHGVGLSLGSARGIDDVHLQRLAEACRRYEPDAVSEHLSWSVGDGIYLNDLLPVPYTAETLTIVSANIHRMQDALKRPVMIENLSQYVSYARSSMSEPEFLSELVRRTGCGLLLDVNNVYVSAKNLAFDPAAYIDGLPAEAVGEIHLAGHSENQTPAGPVLIDDHSSAVQPAVWSLYAWTIGRIGRRPTLIEWDSAVPRLLTLLGEAMWADLLAAAVVFRCPGQRETASPVPLFVPERIPDFVPAEICHA